MIKEPTLNMDALYSEDDKSFVFIATRKWFQTMPSWVIEQFLRAMIPKSAQVFDISREIKEITIDKKMKNPLI